MDDKSSGLTPYLYLCLFSLLIAAVLKAAIEYLEAGKITFATNDPLFPLLWVSFFVASLLLRSLASRMLKCSVCGRLSRDILIFSEGRSRRLCREHLVEQFRREFTAFPEKMVVFYPSLEMKRGPYVYEYRAISDIPEKFLKSRFGRFLTRALSSINGRCCRCARSATVAYFGPGNTPWEFITLSGPGWTDLRTEEIPARFEVTCPFCIVDELCFSLSRFEGGFPEGIILPYNGSGVFMSRLR